MNQARWIEEWKAEEAAAVMTGWDFSHLDGRYEEGPLPWSYREKVGDFLKPDSRILDMGTGGGEFLLSLRHPPELTSVTEGWAPNLALCRQRLEPLGITVRSYDSETGEPLPFADESFDLVLNRHESYDLKEVYRVLKPGGFFLTQQVGGTNGLALSRFLGLAEERCLETFNLENELPRFREAGFRIMFRSQAYPEDRFLDVGGLCWYLKIIPWEFPGFSVDRCLDKLLLLQERLERDGFIANREHRFILIGKK